MKEIASALRDHRWPQMFLNTLGWDREPRTRRLEVEGRVWILETIACKHGVRVFRCRMDPPALANRMLLRRLQGALLAFAREHIVVFSCEEPRRQAWGWAVRRPGGRRRRHSEPGFRSAEPPLTLMERLADLRFDSAEEASSSPGATLRRIRAALDTSPDRDLFAGRPIPLPRREEPAGWEGSGDTVGVRADILAHRGLARRHSRGLTQRFAMRPEDAEQIALVGLVRAARKFDPASRYLFATFASSVIEKHCRRAGPAFALAIVIPARVFWPCFHHSLRLDHLATGLDPAALRDYQAVCEGVDPRWAVRWRHYVAVRHLRTLSEPDSRRQAGRLAEPFPHPAERFTRLDDAQCVRAAVAKLRPRLGAVIRSRFGLDGEEETLQRIGERMGVSREQVRLWEVAGLEKLRFLLARRYRDWGEDFSTQAEALVVVPYEKRSSPPRPPAGKRTWAK